MQKILNKLIKETPCEVIIKSTWLTDFDYGAAWFEYIPGRKDYNCVVVINKDISIEAQIADLLHEQVHAEHYMQDCKCCKDNIDEWLKEYHAMSISLRKALKLGNIAVIYHIMQHIDKADRCEPHYKKAAKKVKRLKIYQKAKDLLAKAEK